LQDHRAAYIVELDRGSSSVWRSSMPVEVVTVFAAAEVAKYDEVIAKMGHSPGGVAPPGCLFHYVTETDGGFRITDVWESRVQYEEFAERQIGPISAEVGLPMPSGRTITEVHNHLASG